MRPQERKIKMRYEDPQELIEELNYLCSPDETEVEEDDDDDDLEDDDDDDDDEDDDEDDEESPESKKFTNAISSLVQDIGLIRDLPDSREKSLALTKLQEAIHWLSDAQSNLK